MKIIKLTQNQIALVDDEDFEILSSCNWHAYYSKYTGSYYAITNVTIDGRRTTARMHRVVMNAKEGEEVDHGNHNTLDNRKLNLKISTHQGNSRNRKINYNNKSGHCGVYWDTDNSKWRAHIRVNGKTVNLGRFKNKADAIKSRQAANIKYGFHENHGLSILEGGNHEQDFC